MVSTQTHFCRDFAPEESSAVSQLACSEAGAVVTFRNGGSYLYPDLGEDVLASIITLAEEGESVGHMVSRLVRRQTNYRRLN